MGPAVMGGRITSIQAVNSDPRIIYVGTAGGGIWKSTTGGTHFKPVFDKYCQSIGALAIDQNNPDVIWAGTGESNMRNSVSIGDGIYKSVDGGDNWEKLGLENSEHISKIVISPKDPNTVFAAVPGHLWNDNMDRGLYKTTDGGKTWNKILFLDAKTGCADVAVNPQNPDIVYATMWTFRRTPYSFESGSKNGGLYKSADGGKTWKKITKGLPDGEAGRVCLALSPSEPNNLLAIVESKNTGLFLSSDGGDSWKHQSATSNVTARPFYFSVIAVDPTNSKRVYRPAFSFSISDDGGQSFTEASQANGWIHSDMHALWIDPNNTSHLLLGTDGGVYMSLDKGNNWHYLNSIPVSQFYHVAVDNQQPYNVYGGLQDNGSWTAPSQSEGGIENKDWQNVGGGDGFWVQPDMNDKDIVYSEYQGGNMSRINRKVNEGADIQPYPLAGETKLRWNWNTPIVASPTNPNTLYTGAQYLYRTKNKGQTWERISGDLTTNDPGKQKQEESGGLTVDNSSAENHCTIFSVSESPLDENIIWAGTDDGNLQVTTDGGKKWTKVNGNVIGKPTQVWVSSIEASRFDKNTVYATFDNHTYGDMKTYVFRSANLGVSWKYIGSADMKGYAHRIREDLVNPKLLFLGTEMGLYVTIDGGESWVQFNAKVPPVAVRDMAVHPKTNDLVLATHGRGILIVDDISPLRNLAQNILDADAALLPTRPTPVTNGHFGAAFPGNGGWTGPNSTEEAVIMYYLKDRATTGDVKVEIYGKGGNLIQTVPGTKRKGINRVTWNMRIKPPRVAQGAKIDFGGFTAPLVEPGTYTVKLIKGDKTFEGKLELVDDKLSPHSSEDRVLQRGTAMKLYKMEEDLAFTVSQLNALKDSLKSAMMDCKVASVKTGMQGLWDKLEKIRKDLVATKEGSAITGEERLREKLSGVFAAVAGYEGRPTDSQLDRMKGLQYDYDQAVKKLNDLYTKDLAALNKQLKTAKMTELATITRDNWEKLTAKK